MSKFTRIAMAVVLALASAVTGARVARAIEGSPFFEETITVSTAAIGITAATSSVDSCTVRGQAMPALVEILTGVGINYRIDSASATPNTGDYRAYVGTSFEIGRGDLLRMIRITSDATVHITCFRDGPGRNMRDYGLVAQNIRTNTDGNVQVDIISGVGAPAINEDVPSADADPLTPAGVIRDTVLASGAGVDTDGDYTVDRVDLYGAGWSTLTNGSGAGISPATSGNQSTIITAFDTLDSNVQALGILEDAGITGGVQLGSFTMRDDVLESGGAVNQELDAMPVRADSFGSAWSALTASDGTRLPADATAGLKVDLGSDNDITGTVTANAGTNLNTSALLTTSAHDAALGTAGSADAQVRSIQGVASMTPVVVDLSATADITIQLEDTDVAQANPLPVRLSDGTNFVDPAVLGTATYSEGTTTGNLVGAVRKDVPTEVANTENELGPLTQNALGMTYVTSYGAKESGILNMIDGSAETDVVDTSMMASTAITINGSGILTQVCFFSSADSVLKVDGTLFFFDADPTIVANTADMSIAEAQTIVAKVNVVAADYESDFATTATACVETKQAFHVISHVVYHNGGGVTWDNDDLDINVFYEQKGE